jgi:hypothetical protein
VIDRGPIDEVYELALDHVEQTFVIESRPASGDIRLAVELESELARAATAEGIDLSNDWGTVRYGNAFVREASGARVPLASRLVERGVELEVANDYVARAEFPLTIDPIISTFPVGSPTLYEMEPSVAYDATTDQHLVVYEYDFSSTDGDMIAEAYNANGTLVAYRAVDVSTESWSNASCANLNKFDQFLCVATAAVFVGPPGQVWGRTLDAGLLAAGSKFHIADSGGNFQLRGPRVGGDPYDGSASAFYCVVWLDAFDGSVRARLVTSASTLVGASAMQLNLQLTDEPPRISKSNGQLGDDAAWSIVWAQRTSNPGDYVAMAMRLRWDGQIMTPPAVVHASTIVDPCVSSPLSDRRTLLVWRDPVLAQAHIQYALLNGTDVQSTGSLTALENAGTQSLQHVGPRVDSDGQRFAVTYLEGVSPDRRTRISSFAPVGTALEPIETHLSLDLVPNTYLIDMDITSKASSGAPGTRYFVGWHNEGAIRGAFYDRPQGGTQSVFCSGDSASVCPCGNAGASGRGCGNSLFATGALLVSIGSAQTGAADNVAFGLSAVPANSQATLFQGTTTTSTFFGDGRLCTSGGLIRLGTKNTGATATAGWPSGGDPPISVGGMVPLFGGRRYYQALYRNAAPFCTSATFNLSNGMNILWLP